jgi:hypothetical protein
MMINTKEYTIKGYKEFETSRGVAWSGNIYKGTKKVGSISNRGDGSCNDVELQKINVDELIDIFKNISVTEDYPVYDIDSICMVLCDNFQNLAFFKKLLKKETLFQEKSTGKMSSIKLPYSEDVKSLLLKNKGDDIEFILNDVVLKHGNNIGCYFNKT